jgi:hypothetical protein
VRKISLQGHRHRWEDNCKKDLKEIQCYYVDIGIDGRINVKRILKKYSAIMWT